MDVRLEEIGHRTKVWEAKRKGMKMERERQGTYIQVGLHKLIHGWKMTIPFFELCLL